MCIESWEGKSSSFGIEMEVEVDLVRVVRIGVLEFDCVDCFSMQCFVIS